MSKKLFFWSVIFTINLFFINFLNAANNPPVLSNFRVEATDPDRVYFDSSEPIVGSDTKGFVVSNKTITGLSIAENQTSGHYFKVSDDFTYWDNNTIRYEGGSDIKDAGGQYLSSFNLQFIDNNIVLNESNLKEIYVDANVKHSGDGSSQASAFKTLKDALKSLKEGNGTKIWIKAGDYGAETFTLNVSGKINQPFIIEGYKNEPGDISKMYYEYGDGKLDPDEMPLFDGGFRGRDIKFCNVANASYYIFRNIQIQNYLVGFRAASMEGFVGERILIKDFGEIDQNNGFGFKFESNINQSNKIRIKSSIVINATMDAYMLSGNNNLLEDNKSYCNEAPAGKNDINATTDYYYEIHGSNNIVRNCYALKDTPNGYGHLGHGVVLKGVGGPTEYNLVEYCTVLNILGSFEARWETVKYNVFRNNIAHADLPNRRKGSNQGSACINILQGAQQNVFDKMYGHHLDAAIRFGDNSEVKSHTSGTNNLIINSVFHDVKAIIRASNANSKTTKPTQNKIYNNTFSKADYLFRIMKNSGSIDFSDNAFKNNIFYKVNNLDDPNNLKSKGWIFENNNFYNGVKLNLNDNINLDPKFEDAELNIFKLKNDSPMIDKGSKINSLNSDYEGLLRPQGNGIDIGAFEFHDNTTGSIEVNAGEDVEICEGDSTTLTATGEGSFLWSTGETTASITVSPEETTTYSVTLTNGNQTATDEVVVTVNEAPKVSLEEDKTICNGTEITLTATGVGDFLWNTGETTESIKVSPSKTTTYSVTATTACDTIATDSIVVNVMENITVNAGDDVNTCSGNEVVLTAEGTGDFLWSTGETTKSITVSPIETTTYSVTLTSGECSATDEVVVTISEAPQVTLGEDKTICSGDEVTLYAQGSGTFLWSTGETTQSITVSPTETTEYSVTATTTCGDADVTVSDSIVVNVNDVVTLTTSEDVTICNNTEVTLTAESNAELLWSTGETTKSITVSPLETTTYTVTAGTGNCSKTEDIVVTVTESASVTLGDDVTICSGEEITLTAEGTGDFLWSTGETTQSITVSPTETTEYSVTLTATCGSSLITSSDDITVHVKNKNINLEVSEDQRVCYGSSVTLNAESNFPIQWSTGETSKTITVSPKFTTVYTVTAKNDCNDTVTKEITVFVDSPAYVDAGQDKIICTGKTVTLKATGSGNFLWSTGETTQTINVSPDKNTTYTVTAFSGECTDTDEVEVFVSDKAEVEIDLGDEITLCYGESITLFAKGSGNYEWNTGETTAAINIKPTETTYYTVTSKNACGSTASDTILVNVNDPIIASISEDVSIIKGQQVELEATGGDYYTWSNGAIGSKIIVSPDSSTDYTVEIGKNGCTVTKSVRVTVLENSLYISQGNEITICKDDKVVLQANGSDNYLWNTGEMTSEIIVNPMETTTYTVTSQKGGVLESTEIVVKVEDCSGNKLVEYNVFPNPSDGIINLQLPSYNEAIQIDVFALNGKVVYRGKAKADQYGVSAQLNLSHVPDGVYFIKMYNDEINTTSKIVVN